MANYETRLWLGESYVEAQGGKTFDVINSFTEKKVASVGEATKADIDKAVELAKPAVDAWAEVSASEKAKCIRKLSALMRENLEELKELEGLSGKSPFAAEFLITFTSNTLDWMATLAETVHGTTSLATPGLMNMTVKQPFGVTAGILPFNGPILMWAAKVGAAVAAGNAIIVKSSEKAPMGVVGVARLVKEAGFPSGLIQTVHGGGETGKLLAEHMEIRKISFTGSTLTGKKVASMAMNSNLKNVTLELGGKSPLIIFDDADVEQAAESASTTLWAMTGQACNAMTRIYVHEKACGRFLEAYKAALSKGAPLMGPIVDNIQASRVSSFLEIGRNDAKVALGGNRETKDGYFFQPTIFTDVPDDSKINTDEIFGPVGIVHKFTDEKTVIDLANKTEYGLWAAVYTKDIDRAIRVAKKLEGGTVNINATSPTTANDVPFGGWKQSGLGREFGLNALDHWMEEKSIVIKLS